MWYCVITGKGQEPRELTMACKVRRRRADAEHIRLETNTMMFLIMFSPDFMVEKYEKSRKILN